MNQVELTLGVVILYNPDPYFFDNVSSYITGLSCLLIIENSNINKTLRERLIAAYGQKLVFKSFGENVGISKPINYALNYAKNNNYSYLLTMDQDSQFYNNSFGKYLKYCDSIFKSSSEIALCSPVHKIKGVCEQFEKHPKWVITSGNLIDVAKCADIYFDEKLFIDGVDFDFCMQLRKKGLKIYQTGLFSLAHELGETKYVKFLWKTLKVTQHNPVRIYYIFRNYLFLIFYKETSGYRFSLFKLLVQFLIAIVFYEPEKIKKLKAILDGFMAFMRNKMGKYER